MDINKKTVADLLQRSAQLRKDLEDYKASCKCLTCEGRFALSNIDASLKVINKGILYPHLQKLNEWKGYTLIVFE